MSSWKGSRGNGRSKGQGFFQRTVSNFKLAWTYLLPSDWDQLGLDFVLTVFTYIVQGSSAWSSSAQPGLCKGEAKEELQGTINSGEKNLLFFCGPTFSPIC